MKHLVNEVHLRLLGADAGRSRDRTVEIAVEIRPESRRPHSEKWGLTENTNRQLRRWLPKGTDLNAPNVDLDVIAHTLNAMPRKLHRWASAADRYTAAHCNNRWCPPVNAS